MIICGGKKFLVVSYEDTSTKFSGCEINGTLYFRGIHSHSVCGNFRFTDAERVRIVLTRVNTNGGKNFRKLFICFYIKRLYKP